MDKKIVILGGAGFIGNHLTKKHIDEGDSLVIIDSLDTSSVKEGQFPVERVEFIIGKVQDLPEEELFAILEDADLIYHFAGSVGVEYVDKNPSLTIFNNLELASYLVPIFERAQTKVIFSSTSEVYGDKDSGDFKETDDCRIPPSDKLRWGYAATKMMTEFMFAASTFPYNIIRFFNIVGPGQVGDYGMVLPKFIKMAKENQDITVFGDGSQIRCFCHIYDAIDMIYAIAMTKHIRNIYNVGSNNQTTIKELAEKVINEVGSESKVVYVPYEDVFTKNHADIKRRVPNTDKVRDWLGISTTRDLNDIIRDCNK